MDIAKLLPYKWVLRLSGSPYQGIAEYCRPAYFNRPSGLFTTSAGVATHWDELPVNEDADAIKAEAEKTLGALYNGAEMSLSFVTARFAEHA